MDLSDRGVPVRYLLRDHDAKFTCSFDDVFGSGGGQVLRTPIRAPKANAYAPAAIAPQPRVGRSRGGGAEVTGVEPSRARRRDVLDGLIHEYLRGRSMMNQDFRASQALAASPPGSQPPASRAAGSEDRSDGSEPSGIQRAESADRLAKRDGKAHKDREAGRDTPGNRGKDKPGKGRDTEQPQRLPGPQLSGLSEPGAEHRAPGGVVELVGRPMVQPVRGGVRPDSPSVALGSWVLKTTQAGYGGCLVWSR
jgi:hypothetical protein